MKDKNIDNELDDELSKESKNKKSKENERKLLASEIADRISENLKPLLENDNSEKIIQAIRENSPVVNVESPIVKLEEKKHEIKMPDIKIPKIEVPKTTVNLKPNIRVKASDVKIPKVMEVRGFMDFAKLAMSVLKNKITIDASKENPLPVQLVHDNKFYEAIGGGGFSRVLLKNKNNSVINPSTEDTLSAINEKVITHDEHIKTLGFHESIGHLSTNTNITVERTMGKKTGIGTGAFTLLEEAAFVQPSGDTQMYIESASPNDDDGGSGANIITIEYFSLAWGQKKTVTVTMNGTTQVALSVADIYRIHKMYINKGGNAAGLIKLTNQAEDVLYGQISQYHAFMQRCIFYVAEDERLTCTEAILSSYSKEGVIGRVFASEEDASGNIIPRARIICEIIGGVLSCPFIISETVRNPNNKRIAIGLAVTGVAAAQNATGTLKGFSKPEA